MSWKQDASRSILGEKVILKSLVPTDETLEKWEQKGNKDASYWFQAKKYSIPDKDRIDKMSIDSMGMSIELQLKISKMTDAEQNKDLSIMEIIDKLPENEQVELFKSQLENINNSPFMKTVINAGYGNSNILSKDETVEQFSVEVLQYQNVALEILNIIRKFNTPLVNKTSGE